LNSEFLIPINETIIDDVNYIIYSIEGRVIDSGKIYDSTGKDLIRIVKPKMAGIYIINLTTGTLELNKKFIVSE
jgi:hypothetical protein